MRVRASSASAVVVSLLVNDVLAAVHGRHHDYHRKHTKMDVTVTDDIIETVTDIVYVTVDWPSGETLGVDFPSGMPTAAASTTSHSASTVPSFTASSISTAAASVTDTFAPAAPSTTAPPHTSAAPSLAPKPAPPSSSPSSGGEFIQEPKTTATPPPPAPPTTMATVIKAVPTTHTIAPAPPSNSPVTPSDSSNSGDKRGVSFNEASVTDLFTGGDSKVTWCYNWGQTGPGAASGLEFIPTLWNNDPSRTGPWNAAASAAIASGSKHLFSFNEPDLSSQANMDVQDAVSAYQKFMQPFSGKALLGAPAVTNGGGQMGLQYMANFISSCSGCQIDFVNIHWYDSATNFAYFKSHVEQAHTMSGGKPVWITEFAGSGSADEQNAFLDVVIPWLDAQPYVQGYAYFMATNGVLLNGNSLSTLGSTFANFASSVISDLIADV